MRNFIFTIVTFCISSSAFAQSKIEKDLQGLWKMTEMNVGGIKLTADQRAAFNANKQAFLDKINGSRVTFVDKKVNYNIAGVEKAGTYTIKPQADAYILTINGSDGSKDTMVIAIRDGKLRIVNSDDSTRAEMVFSKIVIK
jgi:hypothetical protein